MVEMVMVMVMMNKKITLMNMVGMTNKMLMMMMR